MVRADTLYELAHQRRKELLRETELARLAASAQTPAAASPHRIPVAAVLTRLAHALAALGTERKQGSPSHA